MRRTFPFTLNRKIIVWQQTIAFVTGGSCGLVKDMALSLPRKGIDVILTYNTKKDEAAKVVSEIMKQRRMPSP